MERRLATGLLWQCPLTCADVVHAPVVLILTPSAKRLASLARRLSVQACAWAQTGTTVLPRCGRSLPTQTGLGMSNAPRALANPRWPPLFQDTHIHKHCPTTRSPCHDDITISTARRQSQDRGDAAQRHGRHRRGRTGEFVPHQPLQPLSDVFASQPHCLSLLHLQSGRTQLLSIYSHHRHATDTPLSLDSRASSSTRIASRDCCSLTSSSALPRIAAATFSYNPIHRPVTVGYCPTYFLTSSSYFWLDASNSSIVVSMPSKEAGSLAKPSSSGFLRADASSSCGQVLRCWYCVCQYVLIPEVDTRLTLT